MRSFLFSLLALFLLSGGSPIVCEAFVARRAPATLGFTPSSSLIKVTTTLRHHDETSSNRFPRRWSKRKWSKRLLAWTLAGALWSRGYGLFHQTQPAHATSTPPLAAGTRLTARQSTTTRKTDAEKQQSSKKRTKEAAQTTSKSSRLRIVTGTGVVLVAAGAGIAVAESLTHGDCGDNGDEDKDKDSQLVEDTTDVQRGMTEEEVNSYFNRLVGGETDEVDEIPSPPPVVATAVAAPVPTPPMVAPPVALATPPPLDMPPLPDIDRVKTIAELAAEAAAMEEVDDEEEDLVLPAPEVVYQGTLRQSPVEEATNGSVNGASPSHSATTTAKEATSIVEEPVEVPPSAWQEVSPTPQPVTSTAATTASGGTGPYFASPVEVDRYLDRLDLVNPPIDSLTAAEVEEVDGQEEEEEVLPNVAALQGAVSVGLSPPMVEEVVEKSTLSSFLPMMGRKSPEDDTSAPVASTTLPLTDPKFVKARKQPKNYHEEARLASKYGSLPVEERAYQILSDLGMIEVDQNQDSN